MPISHIIPSVVNYSLLQISGTIIVPLNIFLPLHIITPNRYFYQTVTIFSSVYRRPSSDGFLSLNFQERKKIRGKHSFKLLQFLNLLLQNTNLYSPPAFVQTIDSAIIIQWISPPFQQLGPDFKFTFKFNPKVDLTIAFYPCGRKICNRQVSTRYCPLPLHSL